MGGEMGGVTRGGARERGGGMWPSQDSSIVSAGGSVGSMRHIGNGGRVGTAGTLGGSVGARLGGRRMGSRGGVGERRPFTSPPTKRRIGGGMGGGSRSGQRGGKNKRLFSREIKQMQLGLAGSNMPRPFG